MPRKKKLTHNPITLRLSDEQEALIFEVQGWMLSQRAGETNEALEEVYGRAPTIRRILDAVIQALCTEKPIHVLLPIEVARLLPTK